MIDLQTPNPPRDYDLGGDMPDIQLPTLQVQLHPHLQDLAHDQLASTSEDCARYEIHGEMLNSGTVCYISPNNA